MSAISTYKYNMLCSGLNRLHQRMLGHYTYEFTEQDLIEAFVPPHLHELCKTAKKELAVWNYSSRTSVGYNVDGRTMQVNFAIELREDGIVFPNKLHVPDLNTPAMQKLMPYLRERIKIADEFGLAMRVIAELKEACTSEAQMRFALPAMAILYDESVEMGYSEGKDVADKCRLLKPPSKIANIKFWVRQACKEVSTIITAASLMPQPGETRRVSREHVGIGIAVLSPGKFQETAIAPL